MTNIELLTNAYRLLGIVDENEAPSAEQGVLGLRVLNDMMEAWEESDIRLQYFEQTEQDAVFPCQKYTFKGVEGKLAEALAPHYGVTLSPEAVQYARDGFAVIQRKAMLKVLPVADMAHLPQGENQGRGDIINGEP